MEVWASTLEIVNDGGRWSGTGTGLATKDDGYIVGGTDSFVLDGAGGYEGLTAYVLLHYNDAETHTIVAAIFPGEMTEYTGPLAD